jgi:tetratricopeptide (TPR) repeat protein
VPVQKEILYTLAPLYDKVLLLDQADHTYLKEKIQILEMISELEMETGNNKAAREAKRKIVNSIRELLKFQPNDQEMIQNVALALSRLGATHTKCHEHEEASQAHEDAMTLLQSLPADVKLTEHWLQISLDCHVNKSFSLSETNRPKEWIKHTEAGLQFAELVSEAYPQNMKIAYSLAILNYNMASVHIRSGEHEVAICYFLAASAAFEKSTQSANLRMAIHAKGRYADTLTKVGDLYQDLEIPELSDVYYSQVETILYEIVNSYPYNVDYWNSLARLLCHRGVLCTKRGHKASALQFYQRATAAAEKSIAGKNPHIRLRHDAFTCYRNLGFVCENTQNYLGALNAFTRARDLIPEMYQEYTFLQHAIIATNLTLLRFDQAIQEIKRLTHYVEGHEDAPLQIADAWLTYSGHVRRTEQADKVKVSIKYAEERALEALTIAKKNGLFGQKHRAESFRKSDLYDPIRDRFTIGD